MARTVTLPAAAVLALAGGAGWLVGSSALPAGPGTLVLAVGIGVTAYLVTAGSRGAVDRRRRHNGRLLRLAVIGVVLAVGGGALLGLTPYGELATPLAFGVAGALLLPVSSQLGDRLYLVLGAALMLLAAAGGVLALNSAGELYPRGLVGLGAGVLLWLAAGHRAGLLTRGRTRF